MKVNSISIHFFGKELVYTGEKAQLVHNTLEQTNMNEDKMVRVNFRKDRSYVDLKLSQILFIGVKFENKTEGEDL